MSEYCPSCGICGFHDGYCWDCGYDAELEPELIDQPEFENESEWLDLFSDEKIGKD